MTAFSDIMQFASSQTLPPERILDALNTLINEINAQFRAQSGGGAIPVTVAQIKQQLAIADTATPPAVAGNIPTSPYDHIAIGWTGAFCLSGDALYNFIETQLGYTSGQMAAFYAAASAQPVSPT